MNYYNTHACKIAGFLILLFGLRVSSGQLTCYFGSLDETKKTANQSLTEQTCAAKYTSQMNLTTGSSINISYSLIHPEALNVSTEDLKFCVVFVYENSNSDHTCDHDHVCQSDGIRKQFNYKGQLGTVYCCSTNLCNTIKRATDERSQSLICYTEAGLDESCDRPLCMNQTTIVPNGITQYKFGCASEKDYDTRSLWKDECKETASTTGHTTTCFCTANHCNRPTTNLKTPAVTSTLDATPTLAVLLYMTPLTVRQVQAKSWGFIGTVVAVVLLVVLLVALVVLVLRRFREHRAQHVTYTYTQLTADLAEERDPDDEYMLIG